MELELHCEMADLKVRRPKAPSDTEASALRRTALGDLFVAEGFHGVYARRSVSGYVAGQEGG
jgi:hypothetical protein